MDKPTAKDLPKLKTQLPDPLMIITFSVGLQKQVIIRLAYVNTPNEFIYQGHVHNPANLLIGLQQAVEDSRG